MTESEFKQHIKKNISNLSKYAFYLTKDINNAHDLVQDTLLQAMRQREKFKYNYSIAGWLITIMRNIYLNNQNRIKRYPAQIDTQTNEFLIDQKSSEKNEGYDNLLYDDIYSIIENIDDKYKSSFMMFYRGLKYDEISKRTQVPIGTVKTRIHTARKLIKAEILKKNGLTHPETI
ncbi:MAG TPA: RNA polymerase sigma factor [Cyclobacteriaceae bacterium]